jgi:hypothetical protein
MDSGRKPLPPEILAGIVLVLVFAGMLLTAGLLLLKTALAVRELIS